MRALSYRDSKAYFSPWTEKETAGADTFSRFAIRPAVFSREMDEPDHSSDRAGLPANYQPVESAWFIPGPTALIDVYTPAPNTTGTLVVDGDHVIAACDTPGDSDWFAVTLTAGVTYEFGQYAYAGGIPGSEGNGFPLADAFLELYDKDGNLLSFADGGGPNTPSGLDALLSFQATYSGTYYVNATSFDNDGDGVGDFAGDYELFARTGNPNTTYSTPYDISSPLHSIDWGGVRVNREHVAVRNPDGMEGPRPTGQPAADPADVVGNALGFPGKNVIYLYFAGEGDIYAHQDSTIPAQIVVQDPYQYEVQAVLTAANEFSKVADVVFVSNYTFNPTTHLYERDDSIEYKPGPLGPETGVKYAAGVDGDGFDADFFYFSYPGTPGPGVSLLGSMNPPDYGDEGVAQFNSADERWTAQMLQQGGFSFNTLIHEFGHGMGLAHPHDTGGGSSIMLDGDTPSGRVEETTPFRYTLGDYDLNQGVFTMMSYMSGWQTSPYGQADTNNEGYGWLSSLAALDIAVIQDKYGVNEDWATGNDTYVLKDVNEWGVYIDAATGQPAVHDPGNQGTTRDGYYVGESTRYSSIWDAGGVDQIVYNGARDANIDLRAATLRYEYGGSGWMSYATGIYGGYTIANGVVIENATSGAGNDTLTGNDVANTLNGGAGNDVLIGLGGNDTMIGGTGNDTYYVADSGDGISEYAGEGNDRIAASVSYALAADADVERIDVVNLTSTNAIDLTGSAIGNVIYGNDGVNILRGEAGNDELRGFGGDDFLVGGTGADVMIGGLGNDTFYVDDAGDAIGEIAGEGTDRIAASVSFVLSNGADVEIIEAVNVAATTAFDLAGSDTNNTITGNNGVNILRGEGGNDILSGAGGDDILVGGTGNDIMNGGTGNDTYYVDAAGDVVNEYAGEGTNDRVATTVSYTLSANADVERLEAVTPGATNAMDLTGSSIANAITGNDGANVLDGKGGGDVLTGLGGADTFQFTTALGASNVDTIADFVHGTDKIALDDAIFTAIGGLGALNANAFVTGTAARDADDRIIYNGATGQLFYDADGNGSGSAVLFAQLYGAPTLSASDFQVI